MVKPALPSTSFDPDSIVSGSAKAALTAAGASKGDLFQADVDKLREIPGFNVRIETPDYLEHVESIALSIVANGYYPNKPLGGYIGKEDGEDVIFITDGHSRRKAIARARELGAELTAIPVVLKPPGTSVEDLTVALVQDNEGRPLSVMEKAIVAARLKSFNLSNIEIAKRFGVTDRYIEDLLVLAGAPKKVRDFVVAGKVSPTQAVKETRKNAERAADVLLVAVQTAANSGKTKATAKHVKAAKASNGTTETFNFGWQKGAIVEVAEIQAVGRIGDGWWQFTDDDKTHVEILKDTTFVVKLTLSEPVTVTDDEDIRVDDPTAPGVASDIMDKSEPAAPAPAKPKAEAKKPVRRKGAAKKPAGKPKATPQAAADDMGGL